jgi:hypothetical protein
MYRQNEKGSAEVRWRSEGVQRRVEGIEVRERMIVVCLTHPTYE